MPNDSRTNRSDAIAQVRLATFEYLRKLRDIAQSSVIDKGFTVDITGTTLGIIAIPFAEEIDGVPLITVRARTRRNKVKSLKPNQVWAPPGVDRKVLDRLLASPEKEARH